MKVLFVEDELATNIPTILKVLDAVLQPAQKKELKELEDSAFGAENRKIKDILERAGVIDVEDTFPGAIRRMCTADRYDLLVVDRQLSKNGNYDMGTVQQVVPEFDAGKRERYKEREGDYLFLRAFRRNWGNRFYFLTAFGWDAGLAALHMAEHGLEAFFDAGLLLENRIVEKGNPAALCWLSEEVVRIEEQSRNPANGEGAPIPQGALVTAVWRERFRPLAENCEQIVVVDAYGCSRLNWEGLEFLLKQIDQLRTNLPVEVWLYLGVNDNKDSNESGLPDTPEGVYEKVARLKRQLFSGGIANIHLHVVRNADFRWRSHDRFIRFGSTVTAIGTGVEVLSGTRVYRVSHFSRLESVETAYRRIEKSLRDVCSRSYVVGVISVRRTARQFEITSHRGKDCVADDVNAEEVAMRILRHCGHDAGRQRAERFAQEKLVSLPTREKTWSTTEEELDQWLRAAKSRTAGCEKQCITRTVSRPDHVP